MCDPATIITTGLGIAGAAGGYMQQSAGANAQDKAYRQNVRNATTAFDAEQDSINTNEMQQQTSAAEKKLDMSNEALRSSAQAANAAAASGVKGLSVEGLLGDIGQQEAARQERVTQQLSWNIADSENKKKASVDTWQSRVNSMSPGKQPSLLGLGLGIAGDLAGGYTDYEEKQLKLDKAARQ